MCSDADAFDAARVATLAKFQPGTAWHDGRRLRHIRAVVDGEYFVSRVWLRRRRRWEYVVEWWYNFWLNDRDGRLIRRRSRTREVSDAA